MHLLDSLRYNRTNRERICRKVVSAMTGGRSVCAQARHTGAAPRTMSMRSLPGSWDSGRPGERGGARLRE